MMNGMLVSEDFNPVEDFDTKELGTKAENDLIQAGSPIGVTIYGNLGQTLVPDKVLLSGKSSTNNNVQVIINGKSHIKQRAVGLAHEFGHVILYLRGKPFSHGTKEVDDFVYSRADIMLKRLGYDY